MSRAISGKYVSGKKFSYLTLISFHHGIKGKSQYWLCLCDCGNEKVIDIYSIGAKRVISCGCYKISHGFRHGHILHGVESSTHSSWRGMLERCSNPKRENYKYYGGKGIKVCERWLKFENFLEDMGLRPEGKTLDRKNPFGNYCKSNCRWADKYAQANNKRQGTNA